jgi:hypothetical protein
MVFKFEFTKDECVVTTQQPGQILHIHIDYMKYWSLYLIVKGIINEDLISNFTQVKDKDGFDKNTIKWHLWFGRINLQTLKLMKMKRKVNGMVILSPHSSFCQSCLYGKQHKTKHLPIVEGEHKSC